MFKIIQQYCKYNLNTEDTEAQWSQKLQEPILELALSTLWSSQPIARSLARRGGVEVARDWFYNMVVVEEWAPIASYTEVSKIAQLLTQTYNEF